MKSALSLTLIVCIVVSALPVTAQAQVERPGSFDLGGPATMPACASVTSYRECSSAYRPSP